MDKETQKITRYSKPGKWDMLPKNTIIYVTKNGMTQDYIQLSNDENNPFWQERSLTKEKTKTA